VTVPAEKESLDSSMPLQLQLAHIAGDVKLILFQVGDISQRVDRHETVISTLQSQTQALKAAADASTEKAEALALALKEAKEAVEATALQESNKAAAAARDKTDKDALGWSPVTRVFAVFAALAGVLSIYLLAFPPH